MSTELLNAPSDNTNSSSSSTPSGQATPPAGDGGANAGGGGLLQASRLKVPRDQAVAMIRARLESGLELKMLRVRGVADLERAREAKLEWTQQTNQVLSALYDDDSAVEEFNRWAGKVLPEYADLSLFIEQFYDEMEQRLRKLHAIMRRAESEPDVVPRLVGSSSPSSPSNAETKEANGNEGPGQAAASAPTSLKEQAMSVSTPAPAQQQQHTNTAEAPAAHASGHAPATTSRPAASAQASHGQQQAQNRTPRSTVLIVRQRNEQIEEQLAQFVAKLNFEMTLIFEQGENGSKGLIQKLEKQPRVAFAMLLASPEDVAAAREVGASPGGRAAFEIGYCAGKLGFSRVCVIHTAPHPMFHDDYGMAYIPVDPAEGWQLQLGRQLKRAGIEVDLNRLA